MTYPISDLHCDLLCYLVGEPGRTAYDARVRCSIPQMQEGAVKVQVLPIFTDTRAGSAQHGTAQAAQYSKLSLDYPEVFGRTIQTHLAVENASSFAEEEEPLDAALERLSTYCESPVYISLTWNTENRFGGGAHTKVGLKSDGKALLDYMHTKNIAVDLSHTSDALAYDILNYVDKKGLNLPIMASHSNLRAITHVPRNLPDDLACEIFKRGGILGLNFVRMFVGPKCSSNFVRQLEHALSLGEAKNICFGADFFYTGDVPPAFRKTDDEYFFPDYGHSGTYETVLNLWRQHLSLSEETLRDIAYRNLDRFLLECHLSLNKIQKSTRLNIK